jgi:hypothetical protein
MTIIDHPMWLGLETEALAIEKGQVKTFTWP